VPDTAHTVPLADFIERRSADAFLLAVMLPYLSPAPISGMDVQPVAMILAPLVLLIRLLGSERPVVSAEMVLVVIGVASLAYCAPSAFDSFGDYFRVCAPLAIGAMIALAGVQALCMCTPYVFVLVAALYLGGAILQLAAPSAYTTLVAPFLWEIRFELGSVRGPNGLAVEPSMVGNVCAVLLVLPYLFRRDWWRERRITTVSLQLLALSAAAITGSATGILACFGALFAVAVVRYPVRALLIAAVSIGLAIVGLPFLVDSGVGGRAGELLLAASDNPLFLLADYSFVLRYSGILIALGNLPNMPFGDGAGQLTWPIVDQGLRVWAEAFEWSAFYQSSIATYQGLATSGIGGVIVRGGVLGLAAFAVLLAMAARGRYGLVRMFLVLSMMINVSLATPYLWLVFAIGTVEQMSRRHRESTSMPRLQSTVPHLGLNSGVRLIPKELR
jgi:hypothetical protein